MILPPLAAMEALETLARTGSVTKTAEHLCVSQSAISHKLKALEGRLGFALTEARGRTVVLTSEARRYEAAIRPALEALRDAHRGLSAAKGPLEIGVPSGLGAPWLAPKLKRFLNAYPEISLTLRIVPAGVRMPGCDVNIEFTDTPTAEAVHLMAMSFFPVCSPDFLYESGGVTLDRLAADMLLHLDNRVDWARWLGAAGVSFDPGESGVLFSGLLAMYSAAEAGLGICLGDAFTCAHSLSSGRLIRPFETEIPVPAGYWIVPAQGGLTAPASAFVDWVQAEIRADPALNAVR